MYKYLRMLQNREYGQYAYWSIYGEKSIIVIFNVCSLNIWVIRLKFYYIVSMKTQYSFLTCALDMEDLSSLHFFRKHYFQQENLFPEFFKRVSMIKIKLLKQIKAISINYVILGCAVGSHFLPH